MPESQETASAASIVDDLRSVIEEQISPDLKEIIATLDAIDKKLDKLDASLDADFDAHADRATARHNELLTALEIHGAPDAGSHDTLKESLDDVDARLRALEEKRHLQ